MPAGALLTGNKIRTFTHDGADS
ncbi:uncharacterized protein METZ01_LOCUS159218 [marine metagenome]|uniref:Uncharacterized protein n=1 Tax=marine metagenome TaxID=408172 RepID=A0A382AYC0_9ZZZZ